MNTEITAPKQSALPKSIGDLIKTVIKGFGKNTKSKLIKSLIISALIFVLNMVLSSFFGNTSSRFISLMIMRPGNMLSGTMFWSILGANIINLPLKMKGLGFIKLVGQLRSVISKVLMFWENRSKKIYSLGVIISLIASILFGNPALAAVTAFSFIMSSVTKGKSKLYYILRLFNAKGKKGEEKKLPSLESVGSIISGATLGLLLHTLVGGLEFGTFIEGAFIAFFFAIMLFSKKKDMKKTVEKQI